MLARGEVPGGGAAPPERVVNADRYLDLVRAAGMPITVETHEGWHSVGVPRAVRHTRFEGNE